MKCPQCQTEILDDSRFCSKCGTPIHASEKASIHFTETLETPAREFRLGKMLAGKYKIDDELGRGGMGIVYRAEDIGLGRQVAIKVLPDVFTSDPERLARFEREAKVLASLNHPNIAVIHGLEEAEGKRFLVMELVEGETLSDRIRKGTLLLEDALKGCLQIAEGMEAAHEKGIIHRDLKPSNIKITPEGKVKILDFGLAKALREEAVAANISKSPTITNQMTGAGVILGTAAYMSPEQAKGKAVDKRADIWAFGCILYECLTGNRPFQGETITETLAAILKGEPDWQTLPAVAPWKVKDLLRRCLEKDPKERLHDIADIRIMLKDAASADSSAQAVVVPAAIRWRALPWILVVVIALVAAAFGLRSLKRPEKAPLQTMRFVISLPEPLKEESNFPSLAISPDGRQIVFNGGSRLYYRRIDDLEFKPIAFSEGAENPFFSPDGSYLGFFDGGKVKKVLLAGGAPETISDIGFTYPGGGSWETDGSILFQAGWRQGIFRLPASGGMPEKLIAPDPQKNAGMILWPQQLPAPGLLLFTVASNDIASMNEAQIAIGGAGGKSERKILAGGTYGHYLPTGHLIYGYDGKLMAAPLDIGEQRLTRNAVQVLEGISMYPDSGKAEIAFSNTGHLVYVPGTMVKGSDSLVLIDRDGKENPIDLPSGKDESHILVQNRLSPDGNRLAVMLSMANNDIYIYDFADRTLARETFESGDEATPVWAPDGKHLAYTSQPGSSFQIFLKNTVGSGNPKPIFSSENARYPNSFTPDGKVLAFVEDNPKTGSDIWTGPVEGDGQPKPFLQTKYEERNPAFSPDGQWIAYQSNKSGQMQVYVVRYPDAGGERQVSQDGGEEPRWAASGKELFYRNSSQFVAVEVVFKPATIEFTTRKVLFKTDPSLRSGFFSSYSVMPDGQRFIFVRRSRPNPVTQLIVVLNWFEELKRLCPIGKK
jgi:serine/threonine-protein kinase